MECNHQIEKPIKSKRSTNNSKSSELFNLDSMRSKRPASAHVAVSSAALNESLKLTFEFSDTESSVAEQQNKRARTERMRLEKKRAALEKRLAKQKEREAKRMQKEQMRKYRQELKAELNKCAQQHVYAQRSDSATSLANNFDQYLIYKPKSILINQSSAKLAQTTYECLNEMSLHSMRTHAYCDNQLNFNSNYQFGTNYVSARLEPFQVNSSHLNSFNETASSYINYDSSSSSNSVAQFNQYLEDNSYEPINFESFSSENSFQTYENLDDINCSLMTDLDVSVDLIKQDLGLF